MGEMAPFLMFGAVIVVIIAGLIYSFIQAARRRQALEQWAKKRGWRFDGSRRDHAMHQRYGFDCLERGTDDRYAFNFVEGEYDGRPIVTFDYHYATYSNSKSGRKTNHHYFSAVIMECRLPLKPLKIRREGFFDKVANFFGRNTINFESAEFSSKFHVEAPDRKWAYDVIHTRTMKMLMRAPALEIQMYGPWLIAADRRQMTIARLEKALKLLDGMIDNLPDYVRQDLQQGAR